MLRSPQVGEQSQQLGNAIRFSSGLSGRLRELATLMAGRAWTSTYEWYAHERYARDEGIDATVIAAIAAHRKPDLTAMPAEDAMVWRVTDELLYTRRIADATYAEALAVLGERRLLSAVTIATYYEYVSMLLERRSLSVARRCAGRGGRSRTCARTADAGRAAPRGDGGR